MTFYHRFFIILAGLLLLVFAAFLIAPLHSQLAKPTVANDVAQPKLTPQSSLNKGQNIDLPITKKLSVLENLLQQDWPTEDLILDSAQQKIASREDFINASKDSRNFREQMLKRASIAPLDEQGRYVLLNNNRFFSIPAIDGKTLAERTLFLHYAGMNKSIESPMVKVTPYFSSTAKSQKIISHGSTVSLSVLINTQVTTDALLLPVAKMLKTTDAWIIHVDTINGLGLGPRRYFVVFD